MQRIRRPRVFRDRLIFELYATRDGVEDHILEDRTEHLRGAVNVRLTLRGEIDHLGVAAALEVEDAFGRPAMLVVADERALTIRRERRLARTRQTEEQRRIAALAD